jgi:hypothetical protein
MYTTPIELRLSSEGGAYFAATAELREIGGQNSFMTAARGCCKAPHGTVHNVDISGGEWKVGLV